MVSVVSESLSIPEEQQQQQQRRGIMEKEDVRNPGRSDYERSREERIRENRERMQKLGILNLSLNLKALKPTPNRASRRKGSRVESQSPPPQPGPVRRSSRLQNSTPVSYCEAHMAKKDEYLNDDGLRREEGSKPEIYTEAHEKLLGCTERSWTLFVDGYGKDGKRIYDQVRGKTCHQCRQKTLGHRTHCNKCILVQGQFCGDCLYMRYGENVLEANETPDWICPVCRGICNCSLCRQAKGWAPTGTLYRKISSLGYKSVAHYLIQTRRSTADSDKNAGTRVPVSSKRSLPFTDIGATMGEDDLSKASVVSANIDPLSEVDKENGFSGITPESGTEPSLEPVVTTLSKGEVERASKPELGQGEPERASKPELGQGEPDESSAAAEITTEVYNDQTIAASSNCHTGLFPSVTCERIDGIETKIEDMVVEHADVDVPGKSPKSNQKRVCVQSTPGSISGRLRQRRNKPITREEPGSVNTENSSRNAEDMSEIAEGGDSIARRMKMRRRA